MIEKKLLEKVLDHIKKNIKIDKDILIKFNEELVEKIEPLECCGEDLNIVYVDGSNSTVLENISFRIELIRIALIEHKEKEGYKKKIKNYFVSAYKDYNTKKIVVEIFSENENFREEVEVQQLHEAISKIRQELEIKFALDHKERYDAIVFDGSFDELKNKELDLIKDSSKEKTILSISKKSSIKYENLPITIILEHLIQTEKEWVTKLKIKDPTIYYVRFKEGALIFRIDSFSEFNKVKKVLSNLKNATKDLFLYGYPYGLFLAHQTCKIKASEAKFIRHLIKNRINAREILEEIEKYSSFHDKIDAERRWG